MEHGRVQDDRSPAGNESDAWPVAQTINDYGDVVGTYVDAAGNRHGFLLSHGTYTTIDPPGSTLTVAEGINNAGQIVGLYYDGNGNEHDFLLERGVYSTIDAPGA